MIGKVKKTPKTPAITFVLILMAAALLGGCGKGSYSSEAAATEVYEAPGASYNAMYDEDFAYAEEAVEGGTASGATADGGADGAELLEPNASSNRKLITTVDMSLETNDMSSCMDNLRARTAQVGGYIESESIEKRYSYCTVRVPADKLSSFLEAVKEGVNVTHYGSRVEDVTLAYVDVESRLEALRTEQKRLDELLGQAASVEEIIALESRLSEVRYELQSYESQRRIYDNMIDYSTVNISISQVEVYTAEKEASIGERISLGMSDSIVRLGEGLVDLLVGFLGNLPIILFLSLVFGGIFCAIFFPIRAHRKKKSQGALSQKDKKKPEPPVSEES